MIGKTRCLLIVPISCQKDRFDCRLTIVRPSFVARCLPLVVRRCGLMRLRVDTFAIRHMLGKRLAIWKCSSPCIISAIWDYADARRKTGSKASRSLPYGRYFDRIRDPNSEAPDLGAAFAFQIRCFDSTLGLRHRTMLWILGRRLRISRLANFGPRSSSRALLRLPFEPVGLSGFRLALALTCGGCGCVAEER